jgi:hypothetical protein
VLATLIEFIDHVIDSMISIDRSVLQGLHAVERDGVACDGARMFEISGDKISMAKFTGQPGHTNNMMNGVWLSATNGIVALDGANLGFKHFPMIEYLIFSSQKMRTPLPNLGSLFYFYGIGRSGAGPAYGHVHRGCHCHGRQKWS